MLGPNLRMEKKLVYPPWGASWHPAVLPLRPASPYCTIKPGVEKSKRTGGWLKGGLTLNTPPVICSRRHFQILLLFQK